MFDFMDALVPQASLSRRALVKVLRSFFGDEGQIVGMAFSWTALYNMVGVQLTTVAPVFVPTQSLPATVSLKSFDQRGMVTVCLVKSGMTMDGQLTMAATMQLAGMANAAVATDLNNTMVAAAYFARAHDLPATSLPSYFTVPAGVAAYLRNGLTMDALLEAILDTGHLHDMTTSDALCRFLSLKTRSQVDGYCEKLAALVALEVMDEEEEDAENSEVHEVHEVHEADDEVDDDGEADGEADVPNMQDIMVSMLGGGGGAGDGNLFLASMMQSMGPMLQQAMGGTGRQAATEGPSLEELAAQTEADLEAMDVMLQAPAEATADGAPSSS